MDGWMDGVLEVEQGLSLDSSFSLGLFNTSFSDVAAFFFNVNHK